MDDFLAQMRTHVAYTSVGASTVRGQKTPGLVSTLRVLLAEVDLERLAKLDPDDFPGFLKDETKRIKKGMPAKAQHWGVARKVLNIFLRSATYNHYLRHQFNLHRFEELLELPMDSLTAKGLKAISTPRSLPRWMGVKYLTPAENKLFQVRAAEIASEREIARVHLDIYLWLERD